MSKNKQVIIKTLPEGKLTEENYELIESDLPDIEEGEVKQGFKVVQAMLEHQKQES